MNLWCVTGRTVPILATDKIRGFPSLTHPTQLFYSCLLPIASCLLPIASCLLPAPYLPLVTD
ncbi:hypothetical protein [Moorena producens]|uniref:hypothetical protein n=1 Tax=Moorena producens TaxID=1155739 RepID=UPI003C74A248